jgi:hypothetical protein
MAQMESDFDLEQEEQQEKREDGVKSAIKLYRLNGYAAFKDSIELDTLLDYFHLYNPVYDNAYTVSYLGNYGSPSLNNHFFGRDYNVNFFFAQSRDPYILSLSEIDYFNTTTPYTRLDFSQSENKTKNNETRFNVIHSQNINPYLNFTFKVNLGKSAGQYLFQETKHNAVSLYSSYDKENVAFNAGFISNSVKNQENGGLVSEDLLESDRDPEYWQVNLTESNSHFNSTYFFANTEYRLGKYIANDSTDWEQFRPIAGIIYSFSYERHMQKFIDEEDTLNDFFDNTYFDDAYTTDSIRFHLLNNLIQLKQYENANRKFSFGKRAFIGHEFVTASSPGLSHEERFRQNRKYTNIYVGGGIFRESGKFWKWNFDGKFYFAGRSIGQTELNGIIAKPLQFMGDSLASIRFTGSLTNRKPNIFQEEFSSNHYRWKNDLSMEQRLVAGAEFRMPKRKFKAGMNYALINNFLYVDTLGLPSQTSKELLILSAYLDKDFNYRGLHLRTRLLWQKASNEEYVHLPEFSAFVSGFFQFTISKVLHTQLGFDARYNTKYYADAYSPATGLFYLQNDKQYGNYPFIDVYAGLKLKRTRFFFKVMNVGTNFLSGEYITTPLYPMYRSTFRLGLSWSFYD